jgi:hypothetical protein
MPLTYKAFLSAFFGCYFFIAFTPMASAKNHLLVFGGGGEPKDKPGQFLIKVFRELQTIPKDPLK